ncbi:MAG: hypothetical protein AVDCRST_MAG01-01-4060, partial [uncultured Rubrobacteraceae bacterium]
EARGYHGGHARHRLRDGAGVPAPRAPGNGVRPERGGDRAGGGPSRGGARRRAPDGATLRRRRPGSGADAVGGGREARRGGGRLDQQRRADQPEPRPLGAGGRGFRGGGSHQRSGRDAWLEGDDAGDAGAGPRPDLQHGGPRRRRHGLPRRGRVRRDQVRGDLPHQGARQGGEAYPGAGRLPEPRYRGDGPYLRGGSRERAARSQLPGGPRRDHGAFSGGAHPRRRPPRRAHRLAAETQARLAPREDPVRQTRSLRPRGQQV